MQKDSSINDKHPTTEEFRLRETKEAKQLIASSQEESHSRTTSRKELAPPTEPEVLQAQTRGGQRHGRNTDAVGAAAQDEVVDYDSFETMGLGEKLLRGVYAFGFEKPSAVQQRGIVPCLRGRDVIVQGQSGTGKTATFTIGLLQQIDLSTNKCQVSGVRNRQKNMHSCGDENSAKNIAKREQQCYLLSRRHRPRFCKFSYV